MERLKLEAEISAELVRGIEERGNREGRSKTEVIEEALDRYLRSDLLSLVEETASSTDLTEEESLRIADEELQKSRSGR